MTTTELVTEPVLGAKGLNKRFGALVVLENVNFSLGADEAVGIVGPNGAGKTTLLNVLVGAFRPDSGSVTFEGRDVTNMGAADHCLLGLGRTHQIPRPFSGMTVFENLFVAGAIGGQAKRSDAYDQCVDSLELCGMAHLVNRRAETLGLLDRKRLELARALVTRPRALLLDEIGGGLTDGEASELVEVIRVLRSRKIAIVWVEHILHILLQVAQRLVCMDAGKVIADGNPEEVMRSQSVIAAYIGGGVQ